MAYTRLHLCPNVVLCGGWLASAALPPNEPRHYHILFKYVHTYIMHYTWYTLDFTCAQTSSCVAAGSPPPSLPPNEPRHYHILFKYVRTHI